MSPEQDLLRAIARHELGLADAAPPRLIDEPLDDPGWNDLLAACHAHRLVGHLAAIAASGGLPTTSAQQQQVTAWDLRAIEHGHRLDVALLEAIGHLAAYDVDHRVLKGHALARYAHPDPARRHRHDNDLLAPRAQFDDAVRALTEVGYRRRVPPPRPDYDARFAKSVTFVGPDGYELDLHRTLIDGPYGFMLDLDALWASPDAVEVLGERLRVLPPPLLVLHGCTTVALSDATPRWSARRDLAQLVLADAVDVATFEDIARHHRVGGVAVTALARIASDLSLSPSHPLIAWAQACEVPPGDRRRLQVYGARRSFTQQSIESLRVMRGVGERMAFVRAALLPDRAFLDAYGVGRVGWLRRGRSSLGQVARD